MLEPASGAFYPDFTTLVGAVRWWAEKAPDRVALTYLADGENETTRLTYGELDREARRAAASLQQLGPGARVLLCFPPGLDFLIAFLGCAYARIIAVPAYPPRNPRGLSRLVAIAANSGAAVALTNTKTMRSIRLKRSSPTFGLRWQVVEVPESPVDISWYPPVVRPDDVAFLQYTSGSTATPKGVIVAHENLGANVRMLGQALENHPGTNLVTWLPVYHDMGLIGCVLMPLWQGLHTAIMPPMAFLQEPVRWLRAISRYRATLIASPNFGYELCSLQIEADDIAELDLSCLQAACVGAEPIHPDTLDKFCRALEPAGFRRSAFFPCYGLAEATLYASGQHLPAESGVLVDKVAFERGKAVEPDEGAPALRVVSCGAAPAGESIAIVHPRARMQCAPGEIGEIWLAGDHIAKGYWNNAQTTAETFEATVPGCDGTKFLRTGDLGFVRDDQLFVTGRLKDLIIVFGRNHYPQDIEHTVEEHSAVHTGNSVAVALARDGSEGLGIVAEIAKDHLRDDLAGVAEKIAEAVWQEHEVRVSRLALLKPGALPKTSSGKVQRQLTRDLLLRNELTAIFRWPERQPQEPVGASPLGQRLATLPAADRERLLLDLVCQECAAVLGRSSARSLELQRPLREVGLDSLLAVDLRGRLAAATGLRLHSTFVFNYPTPTAMARRLGTLLGPGEDAPPAAVHDHARPGGALPGDDAIAIVSMSVRFPGGADTPETLWELLSEGRDAVTEYPLDRGWDVGGDGVPQKFPGGVLPSADQFDPAFFGISPREAAAIDPQQRLLLELSWEAFERAGISPATLPGSPGGVFVGIFGNDYGARLRAADADPADLKGYLGTGSMPSVASGRVAYSFGLVGPAVSVDTACSSSLVAVHLACQSLRQGECSLALAGGVTVVATPAVFRELGPDSAGAPDGRCKAFSAEADGAGWSEGGGLVLLERLSDAQRRHHPILAVVRGSAVNQDGRSQGLTAPSGLSQEAVIRQALASARLSPSQIDAVEAHGTGTQLGDPIEAQALLATYGEGRGQERPLWLGSLKSNLGHTQAAAGIGGVIKMVLALRHDVLPRTLHAGNPSPHVDWSAGNIRLLGQAVAWTARDQPRRAGVSSFGLSGTNAHLILEEAPAVPETALAPPRLVAPAVPVLLSGRSGPALRAQAARLHAHLVSHPELELEDLAYSLATGRSHFEHRAVLVAQDVSALRDGLRCVAEGQPSPAAVSGQPDVSGKIVFVFPGQGSQWIGMARSLLASSSVFRGRIEACERALARYVDWSLLAVLAGLEGAPGLEDDVSVVQPVLFAVMVALAAVWRSLGVEPDAVAGHSQGEIAAACVAGALSLEDAAKVVARRSQALRRLAGQGAMAAVELAESELRKRLEPFGQRLTIAAVNSATSSLVSGTPAELSLLVSELTAEGVFARMVRVDYASHSAQIEAVEDELMTALAGLEPRASSVAFYSAVTGTRLDTTELNAGYWFSNLRKPVRFASVSERLLSDGYRFFVEASPHPALILPLLESIEGAEAVAAVVGSLRRDQGDLSTILLSLGALHCRGLAVDWAAFFRSPGGRLVDLPTYAFQRQRFWLDASGPGSVQVATAGLAPAAHPLLGAAVALADSDGLVLTGRISLADHPWLADHAVFGWVILPGSVFVELALVAAHRAGLDQVAELTLDAALALPAAGAVVVQLTVGPPDPDGRRTLAVHARASGTSPDAPWTRHARGILGPGAPAAATEAGAWPPEGAVALSLDGFYERLSGAGLDCGPAFRGLSAVWRQGEELFAEVRLPEPVVRDADRYVLHPALLNAVLHAAQLEFVQDRWQAELAFSWRGVSLDAVGASVLRVRLTRQPGSDAVMLAFADASGAFIGAVQALVTRPALIGRLREEFAVRDHESLLHVGWTDLPAASTAPLRGRIALIEASDADAALREMFPSLEVHASLPALTSALDQGSAAPDLVVVPSAASAAEAEDGCSPVAAAHAASARALELLGGWVADDRLAYSRLVLLTRRAVAARPEEDVQDVAHATVWGLARTAQAEHFDRTICVIDTDGTDESRIALPAALCSAETQIALRRGQPLVPRLERTGAGDAQTPSRPLDPDGTVLITGGTGTLGGLVARHLVQKYAVRHLLLISRRGPAAPGAQLVQRELEAAGADVVIAACDAADRGAVEAVLAGIPAGHPLTAVVHAAGAIDDDDAVTEPVTRPASQVLRSKVDAAWHLHELTQTQDLSAFILFSSVAALLGAPGQPRYAAANAFLDGLAHHRRAQGLPALAINWGLWAQETGLTARLGATDRRRMSRGGIRAIPAAEGLALLDAALRRSRPALVAARFDLVGLGAHLQGLPLILRGLVPAATARPSAARMPSTTALGPRLLSLSHSEAEQFMLSLVQAEAAAVLGFASPDMIEAGQSLEPVGLDSIMAVELNYRLSAATGLVLPAFLIRKCGSVGDLSRAILEKLLVQMISHKDQHEENFADADGTVYQQELL